MDSAMAPDRQQSGTAAPDLTATAVRTALGTVSYPGLTRDIASLGMVNHVSVCDGRVKVQLALRTEDPGVPERLEHAIAARLAPLGARSVMVEIVPPAPAPRPTTAGAAHGTPDPWADQVRLASVRHIIPLAAYGLPFISFAFFLGEGSPAIWRGPMVSKAVKQFARGVAWPELDILVVDLPPGTGDVPLSLAQAVALSGAVVVTQPPRVAAAEARKAAEMFRALSVPVLGVVENMTGPFGSGAGAAVARALGVPYLGAVPFDEDIVTKGDEGTPTVVTRPDAGVTASFDAIAHQVATALGWKHMGAAVGAAS